MWKNEYAKKIMKNEGRTKEWLARQCGVEVTSLRNILRGAVKPSLPVLKLMALALNCSVEDLVYAERKDKRQA